MAIETRRYVRLAEAAVSAGYRVSPSQIHHWVQRGLLPEAHGGGSPSAEEQGRKTDAERQLLALLEHRRSTKSMNRLLLLLWLDGWPIEPDRVRGALRGCLPQPAARKLTDADRDRVSRHAVTHAVALRRCLPPAALDPSEAAEVAEFFALFALGDQSEPSEELTPTISRVMGLDRAARDRIGDAEPWYDPSGGLAPLLRGFSVPELHQLIAKATDFELEASRGPSRVLVHDFPHVAEAMELAHGRGVAGFGFARTLGRRTVELAVLATLRAARAGLGEALQQFTAAMTSPPMRQVLATLPEARAWLAAHPERRRIQRIGLLAYQERQAS